MNKRIKLLAKQAGVIALSENGIAPPLEKFAQLIIEESIKVMKENDYHGGWLGEKVKEHFGVEE